MNTFWRKWFGNNKKKTIEEDPMKKFLIVGLGNIGSDYVRTRHNIGFEIVEAFANLACRQAGAQEVAFESEKLGAIARTKIKGKTVILLKPSTYMNLSGKAVRYWMQQEKILMENLLVITDDIHLDFGTLRLKTRGSDGGHNGLKSIQALLGTTTYNRLRFGVGNGFGKGRQVDYVLGRWNDGENAALSERLDTCCALVTSFVTSGVTNTMNNFNGK